MLWNLNQVKDMCTKNSLPYFTLSFTNFNIPNVLLIIKSNPSYQNKPNNTTNTLTHKPNPHPPQNPNKNYYHHNKFNESRHNQNLKTNFNETLKKKIQNFKTKTRIDNTFCLFIIKEWDHIKKLYKSDNKGRARCTWGPEEEQSRESDKVREAWRDYMSEGICVRQWLRVSEGCEAVCWGSVRVRVRRQGSRDWGIVGVKVRECWSDWLTTWAEMRDWAEGKGVSEWGWGLREGGVSSKLLLNKWGIRVRL